MSYAIDTCIVDYLAACGPAGIPEIYRECKTQVTDKVTKQSVVDTVDRLMLLGSIEWYCNDPETQAYDLASGEV